MTQDNRSNDIPWRAPMIHLSNSSQECSLMDQLTPLIVIKVRHFIEH